jgi:hypothetical protein
MFQERWTSEIIGRGADDSANFYHYFQPGYGYYLQSDQIHATRVLDGTLITTAHTFSWMGAYNPALQGIAGLDFEYNFFFVNWGAWSLTTGLLLRQGNNYYLGGSETFFQNQPWRHQSGSVSSDSFILLSGTQARPDFSASGAPISFGLAVQSAGRPEYHESGHWERHCEDTIPPHCETEWVDTSWWGSPVAASWGANNFRVVVHAVTSPAATVFQLTPSTTSPTAGTPFNLTVAARDAAGNPIPGYRGTVTFSSTDRQAGLPASYTFTAADNGQHTFPVTLRTAGAQTVTATDTALGFITGSTTVTVVPAAASRLSVSAPGSILAGLSFPVTVTAYDPYGNIATGYRGTVHFTSNDGQATLPADYSFTAADNGAHTFTGVILRTSGSRTVTATDTVTGLINGSTTVAVVPAAATTFRITGYPSEITAGVEGTFTVTALDPFGNVDTYYRGIVRFTSTDGQAVLESDYRFLPDDNGVHTFRAILKTVGSQSITATDTETDSITGSQSGIAVTPAAADHFRIDAPDHVTANTPFDLTVTALDPYGNIDINYRGTVTFFTTDPDSGVVLPVDYTFTDDDQGVHTFAGEVILVTVGDQVITVADMDNGLSTDATVTVDDSGPSIPEGSGEKDRIHAPVSASPARRSSRAVVLPARALDHLFAEPTEQEWASWITAHRANGPR